MKYLAGTFLQNVGNLYKENYKVLLRDTMKDRKKWRDKPCSVKKKKKESYKDVNSYQINFSLLQHSITTLMESFVT